MTRSPRRFELYRHNPPETHTNGGYANAPDEVQLQGVVFADDTVAIRWLTPLRSTSVWPDFDTFDKVHGHPEYDSELRWLDENPSLDEQARLAWEGLRPEVKTAFLKSLNPLEGIEPFKGRTRP